MSPTLYCSHSTLPLIPSSFLTPAGKVSTGPIRRGESNDPGVAAARRMFAAPRLYKRLYA